jgi:di/tricarboxylate transporter
VTFAFEVVEVDEAAITIMIILGLSSLPWIHTLMGLEEGLVNNQRLFDGFSSNAVMSIIAVMIIGAGLDKTGLMGRVATFILKIGGTSEVVGAIVESHTAKTAKITATIFFLLNMILILSSIKTVGKIIP